MAKPKHFPSGVFCLAIFMLLSSGCVTTTKNIRYQLVEIPDYDAEDYEKLLDSENEEVQYNAISNLIKHARNYADILKGDVKPEKEGPAKTRDKYAHAYQIYRTIAAKTNSKNEDIQVASLIFLGELGRHIDKGGIRKELIEQILTIKARSKRAQYEQLNSLILLQSKDDQAVYPKLIKKGLGSRSWLISSMTYRLLTKSQSESYNQELIDRYRNAREEYDKLLIVSAFHAPYGSEVSAFIREELETDAETKLSHYLAKAITRSQDSAAVAKWLTNEYPGLRKDLPAIIVNEYSDSLSKVCDVDFFRYLLVTDDARVIQLLDSEYVFEQLTDALSSHENNEDLLMIEKLFQKNEKISASFHKYEVQVARKKHLKKQWERAIKEAIRAKLPKFITVSDELLADINLLLEKKGFTKDEILLYTKKYRGGIEESIRLLEEEDKDEAVAN